MDTYGRDPPDKDILSDFDNDSIYSGSVSPSNQIRSGYYDDLDYNELLESESDHGHFKMNRETEKSEEGEVTSDEEGEIKEDTFLSRKEDTFSSGKEDTFSSGKEDTFLRGNEQPWRRKEERIEKTKRNYVSPPPKVSTVPISSTTQKTKSRNVCRHFLQGRCVWGDECRFSHDNSPEDTQLLSRSRSPVDFTSGAPHMMYSHQPHIPSSIGPRGYIPPPHRFHSHPPSHHSMEVFPLQFSRESPRSMAVMHPHYLSHPHPPNLPPHHYSSYPRWGPPSLGGGLLGSVEKVEEDQRWHRLRTITSGWDSDDDKTDDRKLKKKMEVSSSDIDSETEKKKKKKKKEKKKKKHKEVDDEKEIEWVDSRIQQSKKMKNRKDENDVSSEEEAEVRKKKKREKDSEHRKSSKTKQREAVSELVTSIKIVSLTRREKILEELEHVNKGLQRKKS